MGYSYRYQFESIDRSGELFTVKNNTLVREYLECIKEILFDDYNNCKDSRHISEDSPLNTIADIDAVLGELSRNLQQIDDNIFENNFGNKGKGETK